MTDFIELSCSAICQLTRESGRGLSRMDPQLLVSANDADKQ